MKSPFNKDYRFPFGRKSTVFLTSLIIVLMLAVAGCQISDTPGRMGTPPATTEAIIYGKVDSIAVNNAKYKYVFVMKNLKGCTDSVNVNRIIGLDRVDKSGGYRILMHSGGFKDDSSCFNAAVVSYNNMKDYRSNYDFLKGYDRVLVEPKKFSVDFRLSPPYDSVRVDFVVHSSAKE